MGLVFLVDMHYFEHQEHTNLLLGRARSVHRAAASESARSSRHKIVKL
jgi:hypothetical protein